MSTEKEPETLASCPVCGRGNFTARGLKAHVCKGPPKQALAVAVIENKPVDLDKLDAGQIRHSVEFDIAAELGRRAKLMIEHLDELRRERAAKAILVGIYLHQIKAELGHGQFGKWKAEHFGDEKSRTVNRYMELSAIFSRSSRLLLPEIVAANQLTLDLKTNDPTGEVFRGKLDKFVGNLGLTELMQKHGVLKRGGQPAAKPCDPPAMTPQELCIEILEALTLARKDACDRSLWMQMSRAQHDDIKAGFEDAAEQVAKLHAQTHGRAARAQFKTR